MATTTEPAATPLLHVEAVTLFPNMVDVPLSESIVGRARKTGLLALTTRDLRPYGIGRHRLVDDTPYGGGAGMVMRPEPLVAAIGDARRALQERLDSQGIQAAPRVLLLDPQGTPFTQAVARRLSAERALVLVCGRYEGIDERVRGSIDEAISLGDFVLTGGEPGAVCIIDAVVRLLPGVLGNDASSVTESFGDGLLEGPQYTRPPEFDGRTVPDVLLSGDHAKIARWRRDEALRRTARLRPDLLARVSLDTADRKALAATPEQTNSPAAGADGTRQHELTTRNSKGSSGTT